MLQTNIQQASTRRPASPGNSVRRCWVPSGVRVPLPGHAGADTPFLLVALMARPRYNGTVRFPGTSLGNYILIFISDVHAPVCKHGCFHDGTAALSPTPATASRARFHLGHNVANIIRRFHATCTTAIMY